MTKSINGDENGIPEPESSEAKEVFSFFGLCSYLAQVLEQGVINLAAGLRVRGKTQISVKDIDLLFENLEGRTLGQLIKDVRKNADFPIELETELEKALRDRNYITHQFFASHDVDFASARGRKEMISELRRIAMLFQTVDDKLKPTVNALMVRLGVTPEILADIMASKEAEAKRYDTPIQ